MLPEWSKEHAVVIKKHQSRSHTRKKLSATEWRHDVTVRSERVGYSEWKAPSNDDNYTSIVPPRALQANPESSSTSTRSLPPFASHIVIDATVDRVVVIQKREILLQYLLMFILLIHIFDRNDPSFLSNNFSAITAQRQIISTTRSQLTTRSPPPAIKKKEPYQFLHLSSTYIKPTTIWPVRSIFNFSFLGLPPPPPPLRTHWLAILDDHHHHARAEEEKNRKNKGWSGFPRANNWRIIFCSTQLMGFVAADGVF